MELVTVKLIVLALSGIVRVGFGLIPLVVMKILAKSAWTKTTDKWMKKVISVLMFFGGGVLLATCFLHMMPDVRDNFRRAEPDLELPLSEIIFLAGFFLVYMIEDIVHSIIHQRRHKKEDKCNSKQRRSNINANQNMPSGTIVVLEDKGLCNTTIPSTMHTTFNENTIAARLPSPTATNSISLSFSTEHIQNEQQRENREIFRKNNPYADEIPGLAKSRSQNGMGGITNGAFVSEKFQYCDPEGLKYVLENEADFNFNAPRGRRSICSELLVQSLEEGSQNPFNIHLRNNPNHHHQHNSARENNNIAHPHPRLSNGPKEPQLSEAHHNHNTENHHSHMPLNSEIDESVGAEIRNILIVIAISFHGVFEGMGIGLSQTVKDVWYLFLAVSLHECTILFCIGVELIASKTKVFRMIMYVLVVSLVSPVGVAIGILITEKASVSDIHQALIIGCFQGLAAGTLLYVTFFEIFQEEGKKLHRKCYHILVALLGFVLMGCLEFIGGHDHGKKENNSTGHSHTNSDGHDH